jgi:hypothetical protein
VFILWTVDGFKFSNWESVGLKENTSGLIKFGSFDVSDSMGSWHVDGFKELNLVKASKFGKVVFNKFVSSLFADRTYSLNQRSLDHLYCSEVVVKVALKTPFSCGFGTEVPS